MNIQVLKCKEKCKMLKNCEDKSNVWSDVQVVEDTFCSTFLDTGKNTAEVE